MRLIDADALPVRKAHCVDEAGWGADFCVVDKSDIDNAPTIEAETAKHGRWVECDDDDRVGDDYNHHKCTNCNTAAPYSYQYREDWDEGMDGEWYSLGIIDDGINEHLTPYCPNCGAKMDLEG